MSIPPDAPGKSNSGSPVRFTIANLLVITSLFAVTLGIGRLMGLESSAVLLVVMTILGPLIAFLSACLFPTDSQETRLAVVVAVSGVLVLIASALVLIFDGLEGLIALFVGIFCFWSVEWLCLGAVYLIWKSGLESAETTAGMESPRIDPEDRPTDNVAQGNSANPP